MFLRSSILTYCNKMSGSLQGHSRHTAWSNCILQINSITGKPENEMSGSLQGHSRHTAWSNCMLQINSITGKPKTPEDYEKKVQHRRAEVLAFLKSLKIEEAKADLKEAVKAIKGHGLKPSSKIIYKRVPRSLRSLNKPDYTEENLKFKPRTAHRKDNKKETPVKLLSDAEFNIIHNRVPRSHRSLNKPHYAEDNLRAKPRAAHIKGNKKEPPVELLSNAEFNMKRINMSQLCKLLERSAETGVPFDDLLAVLN